MDQDASPDLTDREYRRFWWSFAWRSCLLGFLIGAVLGGVAGLLMSLVGRPDLGGFAGGAVGLGANFVATFIVLRRAIRKSYGGVRLVVRRG